jgi:DNA (cytosine-5)-methyltransferase 1
MSTLQASDLFCGAGGFSAGLLQACHELQRTPDLLAINHWPSAIATHQLNHPSVSHLCENLDNVDPRHLIKSRCLDILLASPECTHHSRARGGKPMSDQSRASAWHVIRWAEALRIENIIVENVKEFQDWGPLDRKGKPIKHRKGELFRAWLGCLDALGYRVDHKVLNSAWFGAATARERLFIQASRRRRPLWPARTHSATPNLIEQQPYRAAREIIDWSYPSQSIFGRKKPLVPKTLKRIEAGLRKFGGVEFVLGQQSCSAPRDVGQPIPTIATAGAISLVEPFLVVLRKNADARSTGEPLPTLCAGGNHIALCEPFVIKFHGDHADRESGAQRVYSVEEPLRTLDTSNRFGLCEPFIIPVTHGGGENRAHDLNKPLPTITGAQRGELALVEPFLVQYYGQSDVTSCDAPVPTITTKDRFGLCQPEPIAIFERDGVEYALMDIRLRMFQPHELMAAMGLDGYRFPAKTTKKDKTKMAGNAVEKLTATALCKAVLQ